MKDNMIKDNELLVEEAPVAPEKEELVFRTPKKIVKKKRLLTVLFIILGLILAGALCFGAYMLFGPEKGYDDSAAFYFSSDLLNEEGGEYVVYDTIDFNVYNYADSLRVSKEPVEDFSVTVKADGKDITASLWAREQWLPTCAVAVRYRYPFPKNTEIRSSTLQ